MGKIPCCDQIGLKKGPWTPEEDQKLLDFIQKHGHGRWRLLPKNAGLKRCGKSCRLRWANYLRPDIKRGRFSFEEEEIIIQLHSVLGNKWSAIASRLPGRTDNEIKNYWNTHIRKRLLKMGIDPVTHTPRLDLLELSSVLCSTLYNSSSSSSSSQLNLPNLLGIGPIMDPDLLNLATTLLSQHHVHQQNQLGLFQVNNQNQFQPCSLFQPNHQQLQNPVREIPSCTTSNTLYPQFLNHQTQLMQTKEEHFSPSLTKLWQSNGDQAPNVAADQSFVPITNQLGSYGSNHQSINISQQTCISNNVHGDHHKLQNMSFLFTPSSSYVNSGSTEDEKDSFCSNILMYDMINPNGLNV